MSSHEEPLTGGNMGPVSRRGDVVLRSAGEWTPAVHRLLQHCRDAGLDLVPAPLGVEPDGREALGFLRGDVPGYPLPRWVWDERALISSVRLLRAFHDVSATADQTGPWRSPAREPAEVVCHNDVAPYNIVYRDGRAVGLIDFDYASPGPRLWDLAYLAYRIVPVTTDRADGFSDAERPRRMALLRETYRTDATEQDICQMIIARLDHLAAFSERMAVELDNPELAEHAVLYRADAVHVEALLTA